MRAGLDGLDTFTVQEPEQRWLEACQSPVWDTALALIALADAGLEPGDPALVRSAQWLLDRQVTDVAGDWAVRRPHLPSGGWAFEYANVNYPDVDDAAVVALALRRVGHPDSERVDKAVGLAVEWLIGMQCADGGWGAFDVDNTRTLPREVPFCDFGEVIDPPSADVTAHAVELLAAELGQPARDSAADGLRWLLRRAGARRLMVRPLGRQPHLRHLVGAVRAAAGERAGRPIRHSDARSTGCSPTRTRTAAGARTAAPTTTRTGSGAVRARRRRPPGR